jgi:hypothetical protein
MVTAYDAGPRETRSQTAPLAGGSQEERAKLDLEMGWARSGVILYVT